MRTKKEIVARADLLQKLKDNPPMLVTSDEPLDIDNWKEPGMFHFFTPAMEVDMKPLVDVDQINAELATLLWVLNVK